ncbi:S26 family signal peptidase [Natrinema altunense]|uniref:S26 family signal peptidase n=1 Tax=Natrinema altunense TaxID=222984 RepID=A0A482XWF0_9EURY|nr:S26 family signal peptidase [Natrinema altunense]RZH67911.1 S26 family signal peptidase [Natrinema altunense]
MRTVTVAVLTVTGCLLLLLWVFLTPSTATPVGVVISEDDSMGATGPNLNIYADIEPETGDIVVFHEAYPLTESDWVVHRVVDKTEDGYTTQGDANPYTGQSNRVQFDYATASDMAGVDLVRARCSKRLGSGDCLQRL